jgi:DNA-binding NarL/FixJ family response regulator
LAGIEVVGEAPDGAAAVEIGRRTHPDVVIMDLEMPGMDGIEAARQLARALPDAADLVLTIHDDDESLFGALRAGARGYVLKGCGAGRHRAGDRSGQPG